MRRIITVIAEVVLQDDICPEEVEPALSISGPGVVDWDIIETRPGTWTEPKLSEMHCLHRPHLKEPG